jgi:hypothetical protein
MPPVPRDGITVGLSPKDCHRILVAPDAATPEGIRDGALFAVLPYTGCRVGELTRLRVKDNKATRSPSSSQDQGQGAARSGACPCMLRESNGWKPWNDIIGSIIEPL